ncbi:unnamed protein product [Paramecium primaurelia]|uniref:Transmembrane protein n=1 Tax=Paramecium primaurelia TaxID=5886 RepID=A0A8S1QNN0_PARPR|nr:unnamed protein product [Paramecium primaurelia]
MGIYLLDKFGVNNIELIHLYLLLSCLFYLFVSHLLIFILNKIFLCLHNPLSQFQYFCYQLCQSKFLIFIFQVTYQDYQLDLLQRAFKGYPFQLNFINPIIFLVLIQSIIFKEGGTTSHTSVIFKRFFSDQQFWLNYNQKSLRFQLLPHFKKFQKISLKFLYYDGQLTVWQIQTIPIHICEQSLNVAQT